MMSRNIEDLVLPNGGSLNQSCTDIVVDEDSVRSFTLPSSSELTPFLRAYDLLSVELTACRRILGGIKSEYQLWFDRKQRLGPSLHNLGRFGLGNTSSSSTSSPSRLNGTKQLGVGAKPGQVRRKALGLRKKGVQKEMRRAGGPPKQLLAGSTEVLPSAIPVADFLWEEHSVPFMSDNPKGLTYEGNGAGRVSLMHAARILIPFADPALESNCSLCMFFGTRTCLIAYADFLAKATGAWCVSWSADDILWNQRRERDTRYTIAAD